jgi:hypothetical protein
MDPEHVAVGPVEPGEDDELVARGDPLDPGGDGGGEDDPGLRRTLVALLRRRQLVAVAALALAVRVVMSSG